MYSDDLEAGVATSRTAFRAFASFMMAKLTKRDPRDFVAAQHVTHPLVDAT